MDKPEEKTFYVVFKNYTVMREFIIQHLDNENFTRVTIDYSNLILIAKGVLPKVVYILLNNFGCAVTGVYEMPEKIERPIPPQVKVT